MKFSDIKNYGKVLSTILIILLGFEINLRLKIKRITITEIEELLLSTMNKIGAKKGYISIEEMQ